MIISNIGLSNLYRGVAITGIVDVTVGLDGVIADDVRIMYSILSNQAKVTLSGMQKFCAMHNSSTGREEGQSAAQNISYIFERMTGILKLNTIIDTSIVPSGVSIVQALVSLSGDLIDFASPMQKDKITLTSSSQLNENLNNRVPGYMNISLDINYSGNIADLPFPSLNGQIVAVYSSSNAVLKANSNILMSADVTLNRYTPVILKNINGLWTRIA